MRQTVEEMLGYFNQIRRVYANELNLKFTNENFSPNEISILILLSNNPSINTSSQLCTILGVSKGLISRSIDALVEKGYIICAKDDADKRIQRLSFSPQAAPVIQKLNEEVTKMNNEVLQGISKEELQQVEATMTKILTRFKERNETQHEKTMSREVDLGNEPVRHLLLILAVPAITSQVVNALYNMVDRMYIGHIPEVGSAALTGVGVCFPIIMIISAFAYLMGMGGAPRASIYMGKKDNDTAEKILGNSLSALIITSIILTITVLVFKEPLLYLFGASENTISYAESYMTIYAVGTIFVQLTLGLNAFISAQGFSTISMMTVIIGAVSNIILDPIFIFGFNMGVRGAAIATVLSQALSAIWALRFLCGKIQFSASKRRI